MDDDATQQSSPQSHPATFAASTCTAAEAINGFVPSGSYAELRALFKNRASIESIRKWKRGERHMPQWAIDILQARAAPSMRLKTGPGLQAGKYNLPSIKEKARLQSAGLDSRPLIEKR